MNMGMKGIPSPQQKSPNTPSTPTSPLALGHQKAKAQFAQVKNVGSMLEATRKELDALVALGDNVTAEDVIKGAGALVVAGGDPTQLASMLAQMPQGGSGLSGWLQQQDMMVKQKEAQFQQGLEMSRHQLAVSALRNLYSDHLKQKNSPKDVNPNIQAPPNGLM